MNEQSRHQEKRAHHHHVDDTSVGLVAQLTREMTTLFSKEVALAKSELTHSVKSVKKGLASVASGGLVLFAGFLVLLWAAVLGLSEFIQPWLAAIIVGGIVALIGFSMLKAGQKKLEPSALRPTRTEHQLHKDRQTVRGATT